jgi:hypothetical protein
MGAGEILALLLIGLAIAACVRLVRRRASTAVAWQDKPAFGAASAPVLPVRARPVRIPNSKLLQNVVGWCIGGTLARLLYEAVAAEPATISETIGRTVMSSLIPYLFGALWSEIPLVAVGANLCGLGLALMMLVPVVQWKAAAKLALGMLVVLSLFTVWIEPWMSISGVAMEAVKVLAGIVTFWFDLIVSVVWCLIWMKGAKAIDAEAP